MNNINMLLSDYSLAECKIHGFGFSDDDYEFYLDIDYLNLWIKDEHTENILFEIAPSTIVFKNVWDLNVDLNYNLGIIVEEISRENPCKPKNAKYIEGIEYDWNIETITGNISFKSIGFDQYLRKYYPFSYKSSLTLEERGGISFSKEGKLLGIID